MKVDIPRAVLLITGSTQGVGLAIAREAAASGAEAIMLTGRDAARGEAAVQELRRQGVIADFIPAELLDKDAPQRLFDQTLDRFGRVDCLVNSAGLTDRGSLLDATAPLFDRLFAVNVRAPFFLLQAFIRHLRDTHQPGTAVNILSMNVYGGSAELAVYSATKAAVSGLVRSAAIEWGPHGVRVNAVAPGVIRTPLTDAYMRNNPERAAAAETEVPLRRVGTPEEVADMVLVLAGRPSRFITGQTIFVDGGLTAGSHWW